MCVSFEFFFKAQWLCMLSRFDTTKLAFIKKQSGLERTCAVFVRYIHLETNPIWIHIWIFEHRRFHEIFSKFMSYQTSRVFIKCLIKSLTAVEQQRWRHLTDQRSNDAKCRWRSNRLDGAVSFRELLGQKRVMQIHQGETLSHQGAITHEVCCSSAQF